CDRFAQLLSAPLVGDAKFDPVDSGREFRLAGQLFRAELRGRELLLLLAVDQQGNVKWPRFVGGDDPGADRLGGEVARVVDQLSPGGRRNLDPRKLGFEANRHLLRRFSPALCLRVELDDVLTWVEDEALADLDFLVPCGETRQLAASLGADRPLNV